MPKRSASPTSPDPEPKRTAPSADEQRQRAREWAEAQLQLRSPGPKSRASLGASLPAASELETPSKTKKRQSLAAPPSTGKEKKQKTEDDDESVADSVQSTQSTRRSTRGTKIAEPDVLETIVEETPSKRRTAKVAETVVPEETPSKRRSRMSLTVPEASLQAALNPPKLGAASQRVPRVEETVRPPSPTKAAAPSPTKAPSEPSTPRRSTRNSTSSHTEISTEAKTTNVLPTIPEDVVVSVATEEVRTEEINTEEINTEEIKAKRQQALDAEKETFWQVILPYLWIILYVELILLLTVLMYFADTRFIGISALAVSTVRRLFLYLV